MACIALVYAIQFADTEKRFNLIRGYASLALSHARELIAECKSRNYDPKYNDSVGSPLSEIDVFEERARLIAEAAAAIVLNGEVEFEEKVYLRKVISGSFLPGSLWGQFVVPSMIVRHLAWRMVDATLRPEVSLISLLKGYMAASSQHRLPDQISNAAPYYRYEHVLFAVTNGLIGEDSDITRDDTRNHMSFGKALMQMIALRNLKQSCKSMWRAYSLVMHGSTVVDVPDFFSPIASDTGSTISEQLYSSEWAHFVNEAIDAGHSTKFDAFRELHWLVAAYLCIAPHRAEHNVLMALDAAVSRNWYNRNHRPGDSVC